MAELLNFSPAVLLGAQTGSGFIGNVLCPGNVLLGATTATFWGKKAKF